MLRLKTILQSNWLYIFLLFLSIIFLIINIFLIKKQSGYEDGLQIISGEIINLKVKDDKVDFIVKTPEKIRATFYYDDIEKIKDFYLGNIVSIEGDVSTLSNNTLFNVFNYKKYLENNNIYKIIKVKKISFKNNKVNFLLKFKNKLFNKCNKNEYWLLFILGDKSLMDNTEYNNFKNLGIAHLLAVSGMHISLLSSFLEKILKKVKGYSYIICIFLFFYSLLVQTLSLWRSFLSYFLHFINKRFNLNLNKYKLLFLTFDILFLINPNVIFNVSYLYSFSCLFGITLLDNKKSNNKLLSAFQVSLVTFFFTLPITVNLNYEINFISIVANLVVIPYVSLIFYPMCLVTFLIPSLIVILKFFQFLLLIIIKLFSIISLTIIIPKLSFLFILIYYFLLILSFKKNKLFIIMLLIIIVIYKNYFGLNHDINIYYDDVGQGDSSIILFPFKKSVIVIDTGGSFSQNDYLINNLLLSYKALGISKIDFLIITHGDFDHMGEAINLVNNFKVENVIFNCGEYNELEKELIKVLDKKKIKYYSCIKELNIDKYKLEFLNTKEYDNENDNSNVIYFNSNDYKFLFMGDAGIDKEKDILDKYNLKNIDFLKVGHHGSNTSSSEYFIDNINPKYSLISVGKNNRYGHPKDEVLDTLKNSKIYRTDLDGSIEIKLNKRGYKIKTCPP